jgi:hypothetical protein
MAAAAVLAGGLAGCGVDGVELNAPILEAAGVNITGKKPKTVDLPDRPSIVLPPSTDKLPEPGPRPVAATDQQQWPADPDQTKKSDEARAKEDYERYCREGDWSGKAGIEEYNKMTGMQRRCRSDWVKQMIKDNEAREAAIRAEQARIEAEGKKQ